MWFCIKLKIYKQISFLFKFSLLLLSHIQTQYDSTSIPEYGNQYKYDQTLPITIFIDYVCDTILALSEPNKVG